MRDQLIQTWRRHPKLIMGTGLGLLAAGGLALVVWAAPDILSGDAGASQGPMGPDLDIAVVAPVEPEIQPGSTMDVGALVDGFDKDALKTSSDAAGAGDYDTVYPGDTPYPDDRYERQIADPRGLESPGSDRQDWGTVEGRGDRLGLGFDGPRPETRAEREARLRTTPPVQRRTDPSSPSAKPPAVYY